MFNTFRKPTVLIYMLLTCLLSTLLYVSFPTELSVGVANPHRFCLNNNTLIVLFLICDVLIGVSYLVISSCLSLVVMRYKAGGADVALAAIPLWVYAAFASFIVTCGLTHFTDVLTLWVPAYWFAAIIRILCATASVTTAAAMPEIMTSFTKTGE